MNLRIVLSENRFRFSESTMLYEARPPYRRNDYLGWIARPKRPETRHKRVAQMLEGLERGGVYMRTR